MELDTDRAHSHLYDASTRQRQCWICLGEEGTNWVRPCKCSGSTQWLHQDCLQNYIDEKQKSNQSLAGLHCPLCKTEYIIVMPSPGLLHILELYDAILSQSSALGTIVIAFGSIYWCAVSYGAFTVFQIYGPERARATFESFEPMTLLVGLPTIPFLLFLGKLIKWEDQLLKLWKNYHHRIPMLGWLTGSADINARPSADKILLNRDTDPNAGVRLFVGALLLPTMSSICGKLFFSSIESPIKRTIIGGVVFIAAKGLARVVLRQQQYLRHTRREVLDYFDDDQCNSSSQINNFTDDFNDRRLSRVDSSSSE